MHLILIICLACCMLSCVEYPNHIWVEEVTDMKLDMNEEWELAYDYKGRLIRYGKTPITYEKNRINIGTMEGDDNKGKMYATTYLFSEGKGWCSESICRIPVDSIVVDVVKTTEYVQNGDTLIMNSTYFNIKDSLLIRESSIRYVYNSTGCLTEILYQIADVGKDEMSCHSYFEYNHPIRYNANLNLQAFWVEYTDWDTFFFFLLNVSPQNGNNILPNGIRYCVNHGKAIYEAEGLYRLDGERLVRMEIISKDVKLKARYKFDYFMK